MSYHSEMINNTQSIDPTPVIKSTRDEIKYWQQRAEAAEAKLRELEMQEPVAWMYPSDLEKFQRTETFAQSFSVQVGCPQEDSVPLYAKPFPALKQEEK